MVFSTKNPININNSFPFLVYCFTARNEKLRAGEKSKLEATQMVNIMNNIFHHGLFL